MRQQAMSSLHAAMHVRPRGGYSLIEMVVSLGAACVLIVGMGSATFLSTQAFRSSDQPAARRVEAAQVQRRMLDDLRYATSFSERSSNAVTFTVPDRTGDGRPDTIRYAWSGVAGESLTYSLNASPAISLLTSVENFSFSFQTQTLTRAN